MLRAPATPVLSGTCPCRAPARSFVRGCTTHAPCPACAHPAQAHERFKCVEHRLDVAVNLLVDVLGGAVEILARRKTSRVVGPVQQWLCGGCADGHISAKGGCRHWPCLTAVVVHSCPVKPLLHRLGSARAHAHVVSDKIPTERKLASRGWRTPSGKLHLQILPRASFPSPKPPVLTHVHRLPPLYSSALTSIVRTSLQRLGLLSAQLAKPSNMSTQAV